MHLVFRQSSISKTAVVASNGENLVPQGLVYRVCLELLAVKSIQNQSEVIPCISDFRQPCILKTAFFSSKDNRREICDSGTLETHIWCTLTLQYLW